MSVTAKTLSKEEYFYGHKACAGCGGSLVVRNALKVLGENAVSVLPAGCMSAVGFNFPQLCFSNNAIISTFAGTASMLTGIEA
ncbi:MAG: pyruvate synthase subunit beta, partial [Cellulosilyticum sp.]|nr:pyruvate synthase subunit beta [Cellulosilyticum sp.]